jgi:hypothetical protein
MNPNTFLKNAPRFLTARYGSLNKYVQETLLPVDKLDNLRKRFKAKGELTVELKRVRDIVDEASFVTFIFVIKKSFNEGSTAAKSAVDTFSGLNVDGFRIGSKYFSGRNKYVLEGDVLAETLLRSISDPRIRSLVQDSKYMSDIMEAYKGIIDSNA